MGIKMTLKNWDAKTTYAYTKANERGEISNYQKHTSYLDNLTKIDTS